MKRIFLLVSIAVLTLPAFGLDKLIPSPTAPTVDGVVADKEYQWASAGNGITLNLALSSDSKTLHVAYSAPTAGWLAVGLGSLRMNGAWMLMGYDKNGSTISEQAGAGHNHSPSKQKLVESAIAKNSGASTVLEFSVPAAGFIKSDKLDLILAYGQRPDFVSMHRWKTSFSVDIGK